MQAIMISIGGVERPLCFSTRVVCDAQARFDGLGGLQNAMASDNMQTKLDAVTWTLARMLDAGARFARLTGERQPETLPPSQEDLLDLYGPGDLAELVRAIYDAIAVGSAREVEAEPPKNAETAPESM